MSTQQPDPDAITIPTDLLPRDGRFGSGPTRIRPEQLTRLTRDGVTVLGTSHRQAPVKDLVSGVQDRLAELFTLPDGYEVVLGNGGSTTFWDMAAFGLVERRAQNLVLGEFSAKFAAALNTPFLDAPERIEVPHGARAVPRENPDVDIHAWPHNETSTGVFTPVQRIGGAEQLVVVDATSAAGALRVDIAQCDVYYFAPQKALGSDGGLWFALMSPAAIERAQRLGADRWTPSSLRLDAAIDNSRKHQTVNTPAIATLTLMNQQLEWLLGLGGLAGAVERVEANAACLYGWAEASSWVSPFVTDPAHRSPCVATLEVDPRIEAGQISRILRRSGIVDIDPYRGVGRNQLRVGLFPSVPTSDVRALTICLDHVAAALTT